MINISCSVEMKSNLANRFAGFDSSFILKNVKLHTSRANVIMQIFHLLQLYFCYSVISVKYVFKISGLEILSIKSCRVLTSSIAENDLGICFKDISESNSVQRRMAKRKHGTSELKKIDGHCVNTTVAVIINSVTKKIKKSNYEEQNDEEMKQSPLKLWISVAEGAIGKNIVQIAVNSSKFVGAHVSIASQYTLASFEQLIFDGAYFVGGIHLAPRRAAESGCRSFALFLSSARQWKRNELKEESAKKFRQNCLDFGYSTKHIVPHGSYLLNIGSPNTETLQKSRDMLLHEVQCCEKLGLSLYNFHPGILF